MTDATNSTSTPGNSAVQASPLSPKVQLIRPKGAVRGPTALYERAFDLYGVSYVIRGVRIDEARLFHGVVGAGCDLQ